MINLAFSPSFSKRTFHSLCDIMLPKLENLELNIIRNSKPYSIMAHSKLLSHLTLRRLSLGISEAKLSYISKVILKYSATLEVIKLKVSHMEVTKSIENKENTENPFSFFLQIKKLKSLELDFSHSKMQLSHTREMWGILGKLEKISTLKINLLSCDINEEKSIKL